MRQTNKQRRFSLLALILILVMAFSLMPGMVQADNTISNVINPLVPIVTQHDAPITAIADSNPAIYVISADKQDVHLDYVASMDLKNLATNFDKTWEEAITAIKSNPDLLRHIESVDITIEFQLDEHLELVEQDWLNVQFSSSFFSIDRNKTIVNNDNKKVELHFYWDSSKITDALINDNVQSEIILKGVPMLVHDDWAGSSVNLTNSGSVIGKAKIDIFDEEVIIGNEDGEPITQSNTIQLQVSNTPAPQPAPAPAPAPAPVVEPTEPPTETATLYFDPNGGTWPSGSTEPMIMYAAVGDMVRLPLAPSKEGANFVYWEGSRYNPGELYEVTGDHKFTAHFEDYSSAFAGTAGKPADNQQQAPAGNQQLVTELPKTGEQSTTPAVIASLAGLSLLIVLRKKISK